VKRLGEIVEWSRFNPFDMIAWTLSGGIDVALAVSAIRTRSKSTTSSAARRFDEYVLRTMVEASNG